MSHLNLSRKQDAALLSLLTVRYPEGRRHFDTSTCDAAMEWRDAETSSCASIYSAQLAVPALAFQLLPERGLISLSCSPGAFEFPR
jgi:hypothetical protein